MNTENTLIMLQAERDYFKSRYIDQAVRMRNLGLESLERLRARVRELEAENKQINDFKHSQMTKLLANNSGLEARVRELEAALDDSIKTIRYQAREISKLKT